MNQRDGIGVSGGEERSAHTLAATSPPQSNGWICPIPAVRNTHQDRLDWVDFCRPDLPGPRCTYLKSCHCCRKPRHPTVRLFQRCRW
jgi:hypothetical protein